MTSLTASHGSSAQAHLPNKLHLGEGAVESREMGAITPQKEDTPKAKPLAHFVAGGYVGCLSPYLIQNLLTVLPLQNRWNDSCHIDESPRRS